MAFVQAANGDATRTVADELGFKNIKIEAGDVVAATTYLKENASPEILLVEIGTAEEAPAQLDALADFVNPLTKVVVTGKTDSIRFYQWLSDLGIDGYLVSPFTAPELKQTIAKGSVTKKAAPSDGKPATQKKIVALMGARGGVGTTMIATNLAAVFAKDHQYATAIVDFDPYFGSVALNLDLEPGRGLRDALEKPDRVDALFLERVMVKPFTNFSVLSAEEPLMDPVNAQPNAGEMIFGALKEKFSMIVVDLPRQMNPVTRHVLNMADHVIIVAESQITSLRDSLRLRDYVVEQLKRPAPMLVLNRVGLSSANELPPKEFAKNYGHGITEQFQYQQEMIAATAQGELFDAVPKLNGALNHLRGLAKKIVGTAEADADEDSKEKEAGGSLMARLRGKK